MHPAASPYLEWQAFHQEARAFERMLVPIFVRSWADDGQHVDLAALARLRRHQAQALRPAALNYLKQLAF